jgi:phosphoribosylpyrophosphate synthetase
MDVVDDRWCKRARQVRHITAVLLSTSVGHGRNHKDKPRVPIGAKMIARFSELQALHAVTMDGNADHTGFFEKPVDHLYASSPFMPLFKEFEFS